MAETKENLMEKNITEDESTTLYKHLEKLESYVSASFLVTLWRYFIPTLVSEVANTFMIYFSNFYIHRYFGYEVMM